jgi:hypothetical protein
MQMRVQRGFGRSRWATLSLVYAFLAGAAAMFAQRALDNEAILKLVRTGLSDDIILSIVSNEPGKYAVAVDDLLKLKSAGVPDRVVAAMIEKQNRIPAASLPSADMKTGETAVAYHPSWMSAPIPQWTENDAKQVLADSPWVKKVQLDIVRNLSLFERRDGGDWDSGIGTGFGLAATGLFGDWREAQALEHAYARATLGTVMVRWESAFPVRAAESKTGETKVPGWVGDYYAIAVHHIRPPFLIGNPARQLKGVAYLKRDMKKDLKPFRVVTLPETDGLATFVYLFPRSTEIRQKGGSVDFVAQIGRLFVVANFVPEDMQIQGEPQL